MTETENNVRKRRRIAIDIGSTVVKLAELDTNGELCSQVFHPRDFEAGIAAHLDALMREAGASWQADEIMICSSANGGLRVGIVSLTEFFSGAVLRNQALNAGANPVFVHQFDEQSGFGSHVDVLLLGGGIDCEDAAPLAARLSRFDASRYQFGAMVYAGNIHLHELVSRRFPDCRLIANPLATSLRADSDSVFDALRRAYLDDLVYKDGISDLKKLYGGAIWPTPEIVNRGFQKAVFHRTSLVVGGPSLLMDIGGATTDLHYTVEIVADESAHRPSVGDSVARYVYTDLGIVASRESTTLQMRGHPGLYVFLEALGLDDRREVYSALRDGDYDPTAEFLSYACLFLALSRFAEGRGPGLPQADIGKVSQIILTGGAVQGLDVDRVGAIVSLLVRRNQMRPIIVVDCDYRIWLEGMTWSRDTSC